MSTLDKEIRLSRITEFYDAKNFGCHRISSWKRRCWITLSSQDFLHEMWTHCFPMSKARHWLTLVLVIPHFQCLLGKCSGFVVIVTVNIWHHLESLFSILQMHFTEIRSLKTLQINQTRKLSVEFSCMNLKQASINISYLLVYQTIYCNLIFLESL